MPRQRSTIRDVARKAGVSVTTVSHTFSGNGVVNEHTQARVRHAAIELGYHPDVLASGLRKSRLGVVGLVMRPAVGTEPEPLAGVDYFPRFAGAAALAALAEGYALMLVADPSIPNAPATAWACDGIVVTDPVAGDPLIAALRQGGMPYALVGADPADPADPHVVDIATAAITDRVIEHLAAAGSSRPALLVGTDPIEWNTATEQRYRQLMEQSGAPATVFPVPERETPEAVSRVADELLAMTDPPDGLYCLMSDHARGVTDRLIQLGVRVPEDIAVVCGSDAENLRGSAPTITSIDLQPEALARQAVAELLLQLEPDRDLRAVPPAHGALILRDSTRA